MPHETLKCLAMVLSYSLLFVVVIGRIEEKADAERLLQGVALAAPLMAAFGLLHFATTDGRFFWFYWYPHRLASQTISGPVYQSQPFRRFPGARIRAAVGVAARRSGFFQAAVPGED